MEARLGATLSQLELEVAVVAWRPWGDLAPLEALEVLKGAATGRLIALMQEPYLEEAVAQHPVKRGVPPFMEARGAAADTPGVVGRASVRPAALLFLEEPVAPVVRKPHRGSAPRVVYQEAEGAGRRGT